MWLLMQLVSVFHNTAAWYVVKISPIHYMRSHLTLYFGFVNCVLVLLFCHAYICLQIYLNSILLVTVAL